MDNKYYMLFIHFIIIVNSTILMMYYHRASKEYLDVLDIINFTCIMLILVDSLLNLIA